MTLRQTGLWRTTLAVMALILLGGGIGAQAELTHAATAVASSSPCTKTLSPGADVAGALGSAVAGNVICLNTGSYPALSLQGNNPGGYVTLQPAPGANVTVAGGIESHTNPGLSFLRIQGLNLTGSGFMMYSDGHDLQFINNNIANADYGVVIRGINTPITNVLVQGNTMHNIDVSGGCNHTQPAPAGGAQGVTIVNGDGVTIRNNTFKSIGWHYIQGGGGALGVTVDGNVFEGPAPIDDLSCAHLNAWQIWAGGNNDVFENNIVYASPGMYTDSNALMFETGPGGGDCSDSMSNTVVNNNLFIGDGSFGMQIMHTTNLTVTNNTVVGSTYGVLLDRNMACGPGMNATVERNISVDNTGNAWDPTTGRLTAFSPNLSLDTCTGMCTYDYNVTTDASANSNGSTHYVTHCPPSQYTIPSCLKWEPQWQTTTWNGAVGTQPPAGYYQPMGLPFAAGYRTTGATPPAPTPSPVATSTPAPTATATPAPTATATATPTPAPSLGSAVLVGNNAVQATADHDAAGSAEALQYTASNSGTVGSLSLYIDSGTAATSAVVGLYSDNAGKPGTLLTKGTITTPKAGAWNTVSVSAASVTAGTKYWLALLGLGGQINFRDVASGGGLSQNSAQSTLTGLPSAWSGGAAWNNSPASFYAATTASAPTPAPVSISNVPCTVTLNGLQQTGTCSGTFTPGTAPATLAAAAASEKIPASITLLALLGAVVAVLTMRRRLRRNA